jgi:type IV pilus biogenesis protein CpaD/CtpE
MDNARRQARLLGIVAHFVSSSGELTDLPIALPQLTGAHTGVRIAEIVDQTLQQFGVDSAKLGYFVLDNAANNDTAIAVVAEIYDFLPIHRLCRQSNHLLALTPPRLPQSYAPRARRPIYTRLQLRL